MRLYHFTALLHLPEILKEGLRIGEVPISPTVAVMQVNAPNLTTNSDPNAQTCWCRGIVDKTKIRMTVEVPDDNLTSFRQVIQQYKMRSSWVKALDPYYERRHWYFAFGGVPVDRIVKIEMFEDGSYRELASDELQRLAMKIEEEREEKLIFIPISSGRLAGYHRFEFRDGHHNSWLLDGDQKVNELFAA